MPHCLYAAARGGRVRASVDEGDGVLGLLKPELLIFGGGLVVATPAVLLALLLAPLDEALD